MASRSGRFSIIGPKAVIGEKTIVQSHVVIEGEVAIGAAISLDTAPSLARRRRSCLFAGTKTQVKIATRTSFANYCTTIRGSAEGASPKSATKKLLMAGAHIGHNCASGNNVIIANNCLLGGHVPWTTACFLGGGSTFHQFHAHRATGDGARQLRLWEDLPPFVIAQNANSVFGVKRGWAASSWLQRKDRDEIKAAFKLLYMSGPKYRQAIEKAATMKSAPQHADSWTSSRMRRSAAFALIKRRRACCFAVRSAVQLCLQPHVSVSQRRGYSRPSNASMRPVFPFSARTNSKADVAGGCIRRSRGFLSHQARHIAGQLSLEK